MKKNSNVRNFIFFLSKKPFALRKNDNPVKKKECDIIPHVEKFYNNIIKQNSNNLKHVLASSHTKKSMNFLLKLFQVNEKIIKDDSIREDTVRLIYEIENKLDDNDAYVEVLKVFTPLFEQFPTNDLLKDLMVSFKKKNYLFSLYDSQKIITSLDKIKKKNPNIDMKEYSEVKENLLDENPDTNKYSKEHLKDIGIDKLKNIDVSINHRNNKVSFTSRHFLPKIRLIGIDDYSYASVFNSLRYLEKETPNIVIFEKRPIYDLGMNEKHIGMLDAPLLKEFYSEVLKDKTKFIISDVERIVWENKESIKSPSFVHTIIYRALFNLNQFNDIKVYFADMPLYNEIEILVKKQNDLIQTKDFFTYAKLNLLLEKFIWLTQKCVKECPSCTGFRMEHPHTKIENILNYQDLYIPEKFDFMAENIKKVLLSNLDEPFIYAFVQRKSLFVLSQSLAITLENLEKYSPIKEKFEYDYGNPKKTFDENSILNKDSREVFMNKWALFSSLYSDTPNIPETSRINREFQELNKYYEKYKEKLNYVDDLKLWSTRKFDSKCFPAHLMINKFLNKNKI